MLSAPGYIYRDAIMIHGGERSWRLTVVVNDFERSRVQKWSKKITQVRRNFSVEFHTIRLTLHSRTNGFSSAFFEKYIEFLTRCDFVSGFSGKTS